MRQGGCFLLASSGLHVIGWVLSGFSAQGLFLLFPAGLYVLLFAGLARSMMWVAWIAFFCMVIGAAGTFAELYRASAVPAWVLWGIVVADLIAAVLLFAAIWVGPKSARAQE